MQAEGNSLLSEIERFCREARMAESTFGRHVVNDGKLCARLRDGKDVTLETAGKIRSFIRLNQEQAAADGSAEAEANEQKGTDMTSKTAARKKSSNKKAAAPKSKAASADSSDGRPFRFYDNRQKYLAFVNTTNEKRKVAERVAKELALLKPKPPALRLFDAGMGDGTVLSHVMRAMHQRYPTMPFLIVGKEISLEDVRLSLEKLPDRFMEHPASCIVITNLYYAEAPGCVRAA